MQNPEGISNNQVNEIKNLRKELEYLQGQVTNDDEGTMTDEDDDDDEEMEAEHIAKR